MIEIIPNWHPVLVHFTITLLSLSVVFHFLVRFLPKGGLRHQLTILARWNLCLGAGFAILTAVAGWYASTTVSHDAESHAVMMTHRNWALSTLALFVLLSGYSLWRREASARPGYGLLAVLLAGGLMLAVTGWWGTELVYRHGTGVMSLPDSDAGGHDHDAQEHSATLTGEQGGEVLAGQEDSSPQEQQSPEQPGSAAPHAEAEMQETEPPADGHEDHDHAH